MFFARRGGWIGGIKLPYGNKDGQSVLQRRRKPFDDAGAVACLFAGAVARLFTPDAVRGSGAENAARAAEPPS